jgi:hypothetical protein
MCPVRTWGGAGGSTAVFTFPLLASPKTTKTIAEAASVARGLFESTS